MRKDLIRLGLEEASNFLIGVLYQRNSLITMYQQNVRMERWKKRRRRLLSMDYRH